MTLKKQIYLVRHGETDFNRRNIVQGSGVDSDLNELGKQQAEAFYQYYQQIRFDKIYISLLKRTQQSVSHFLEDGIPYQALEGLNEISWGDYEGKEHNQEFHKAYLQRVEDWRNGLLHLPLQGGESPLEMQARQHAAWEIIKKDPAKTILICMHGRALKSFLCLILNLDLSKMDSFEHQNLGLYQIDLLEDMSTKLIMCNDAAHLGKLEAVRDIT